MNPTFKSEFDSFAAEMIADETNHADRLAVRRVFCAGALSAASVLLSHAMRGDLTAIRKYTEQVVAESRRLENVP